MDSPAARPLSGTERATRPFWSPDSRSIAFITDTRLRRIDIDGGSAQTLASGIPVPLGGAWNTDGTIVFANNPGGPLFRVSARGGEVVAATRVAMPQQRGHMYPRFLPDGRHFLFFVSGSPDAHGVHVGRLDSFDETRLFDADTPAVYADGHLLFVREGKLWARAFDPDRLELQGDAYAIGDQMTPGTSLSASAAGTIAYRTASPDSGRRQLVWVDRSGRETDRVVYSDSSGLAYQSDKTGRPEIYLRPFPGPGADVRVSVDGGAQVRWNPSGTEVFYVAPDNRLMAVPMRFLADGRSAEPGTPAALFTTTLSGAAGPVYKQQYMVSADGKSFVMHSAVGEASASPITVILNWKPRTR